MEIESVKCECCGLKEDCTQDYISEVKANFEGKWLCGLCSEAVRDEMVRGKMTPATATAEEAAEESGFAVEEAVRAHMSFCGKFRANPAVLVADGMRQMLRRRSGDLSAAAAAAAAAASAVKKKFGRSNSSKLY